MFRYLEDLRRVQDLVAIASNKKVYRDLEKNLAEGPARKLLDHEKSLVRKACIERASRLLGLAMYEFQHGNDPFAGDGPMVEFKQMVEDLKNGG